jgi:hypothetical protein
MEKRNQWGMRKQEETEKREARGREGKNEHDFDSPFPVCSSFGFYNYSKYVNFYKSPFI